MTSARRGPIVVGVDGSDSALRAVRWAARDAERHRAPLRLVTAVPLGMDAHTDDFPIPAGVAERARKEADSWLAEAVEAAAGTSGEIEVTSAARHGAPAMVLVEESHQARRIVVATRGLGEVQGLVIGSTTAALVAHGRCPVAVVRGDAADQVANAGPVVVGVDGSPGAEVAVAAAFEEASLRRAGLVAVHTWSDMSTGRWFASDSGFDWEVIEQREQVVLAEALAGWQERYPDVVVHRVVQRDRPVRYLVEHAARAQLLVVGSRGRGGFPGMLLGSTSHALLYTAPCPLLVVRS